MKTTSLQYEISGKTANFEKLTARIIKSPKLLPEIFEGLEADTARLKYGCLKILRLISEREPAVLYPEIGRFFRLMDSDNTILKWSAIIIVGNLAAADSERKIDRALDRYLKPISGPVMITAANAIGGAGKIARAKPYLADRIARALVQVEEARYETTECRNVALGHAVQAMDGFFEQLKQPEPVVEFVNRQLSNSRNAVRKKAATLLKRHCRQQSGISRTR